MSKNTECRPVVGRLLWEQDFRCSIHRTPTKDMDEWSSLVYGNCLENSRLRDGSVGSNPTLSSKIKL